jgi:hypothetical protein
MLWNQEVSEIDKMRQLRLAKEREAILKQVRNKRRPMTAVFDFLFNRMKTTRRLLIS